MSWGKTIRLRDLGRGPVVFVLEPDADQRAEIARALSLESLPSLTARLTLTPWLDGVEITGRFDAVVEQLCAASAEAFEQPLSGEIDVRAAPADSPHAPGGQAELELDAEADDPPDVLRDDMVDLAAYVVEHLSLEIDPFARKPGVAFEYTPPADEESPFAVLKKLKDSKP
ncbi:MAG: YceD family protein [Phenylobacterium sp.]